MMWTWLRKVDDDDDDDDGVNMYYFEVKEARQRESQENTERGCGQGYE